MIAILDYGMGNSGSILSMIKKIGRASVLTTSPQEILDAEAVILPGVGSFDNAMNKLNEIGILEILEKKIKLGNTPFLGICLGMQLLFEGSQEGHSKGLGWLSGTVVKFPSEDPRFNGKKIPHMGWNYAFKIKNDDPLFSGFTETPRFYFVHSYHVKCRSANQIVAKTLFGYEFTSVVRADNIVGVQFHPEKSHGFGLRFLKNFFETMGC